MPASPYDTHLGPNAANHAPLTPLTFLAWAAQVYPERLAVAHGTRRFSWSETDARARRLASALVGRGIGRGTTVTAILSNTPEMIEAHFGVPMAQAVLHAINTRLDPRTVAFQLEHAQAAVLLVDREHSELVRAALTMLAQRPLVIDVDDPEYRGAGERVGDVEYEALLADGDPRFPWQPPADEWQAIALNYTSGTTGNPKGAVYHHRGAHLNAVSNALGWGMPRHAVLLWTLPMFHCNGWCFPWTMALLAGTNVCLRRVEPAAAFALIREHRVTHYCGAPVVHSTLAAAAPELREGIAHRVSGLLGGAPPQAASIEALERLGIDLTHSYGLTETYGPAALCAKHEEWSALEPSTRAALNARQGVRTPLLEAMEVRDPDTLAAVPWDGRTVGEIVFRGNSIMRGYLSNPTATEEAFRGGWLHSGDLAVTHPDGYVEIKDRSKDVIISGGENISSLEVEEALHRHPAVLACAVVAQPHERWGETPCAFVELRPGHSASAAELIEHCRAQLAGFKVPGAIRFEPIPRTSTGKVQKYLLRERARSAATPQ